MRIEQDRMALYLVSHYEKVEKIEFTSFQQNKLTGTWNSNDHCQMTKYLSLFLFKT